MNTKEPRSRPITISLSVPLNSVSISPASSSIRAAIAFAEIIWSMTYGRSRHAVPLHSPSA